MLVQYLFTLFVDNVFSMGAKGRRAHGRATDPPIYVYYYCIKGTSALYTFMGNRYGRGPGLKCSSVRTVRNVWDTMGWPRVPQARPHVPSSAGREPRFETPSTACGAPNYRRVSPLFIRRIYKIGSEVWL